MIIASDTNILLDVFKPDEHYEAQSMGRLQDARNRGTIIVCDVAYAELVPNYSDRAALVEALQRFDIIASPIDTDIAYEAGRRWARYREEGGPRTRILADFIIGAHALIKADAFLTRDNRFFSYYFPELNIR